MLNILVLAQLRQDTNTIHIQHVLIAGPHVLQLHPPTYTLVCIGQYFIYTYTILWLSFGKSRA